MAQQQQPQDPSNLNPTRYSEKRVPQFVGGDYDPSTGNLIPGSKLQAGGQAQPTPTLDATPAANTDAADLTPATPTTRLGTAGNDFGDLAKSIGTSVAASAIGKGVSNAFSSKSDSGTGGQPAASSSTLPNAGGFATGGGSGNGGGSYPSDSLTNLQDFGSTTGGPSSSFAPDTSQSAGPSPAPSAPAPSGGYSPPPSGGSFGSGGDSGDDSGGGGSGTVICTELHRQGLLIGDTFEADQTFGAMVRLHHPDVYAGYIVWAPHIVKAMQRSKRFTRFVNWAAAPWANYMAIRQGRNGFPSIRGVVTFHVGWALCWCIGTAMAEWRDGVQILRA